MKLSGHRARGTGHAAAIVALCSLPCALTFASGCARAGRESASARPNVLLITIDTFRADRLGAGVAPALDALAARSVNYTNARSAVPLTLPSHTTIHTGLLPPAHGVRENGRDRLSDSHVTIARALKNAGYNTAAFVGAFVLDRRFGLAQGFDTYDDQIPRDPRATERLEAERPAVVVINRALTWFAEHAALRTPRPAPFFVWIHLYDPHAPYTPPPEFRARTSTPYDGEIAYADSQLARVFDWLASHHLIDSTLIIVAGDHGEGLGDHGEATHGMLLYDSTLHVPLIVSAPRRDAAVIAEPVTLAMIAPTILGAAGVELPDEVRNARLPPLGAALGGQEHVEGPDLYAETEYPRVAGWSPLQALTDGRWKAIRAGAATELYDLRIDPQELHDVASMQATTAAAFASRIATVAAPAKTSGGSISADAQERLRALGYVATSVQAPAASDAPDPSTHIAAWNEFENALSSLNAHQADALPRLAKLAAANPEAPVFQTTYAQALMEAHRTSDALAVYRAAAKKWPTDAVLLHDLAVAARSAGQGEEARKADEAAIALAPDNAVAHNGAGLIAIDQNRPVDAAREFGRAVDLDPDNASYIVNLGNAKRAQGDASGAEQAYRRALETNPKAGDAANGLGVLLVEARRPAEAIPFFERAVAAAPDSVEAKLNLGIAFEQSGQRDRAAAAYRDVLKAPARYAREREAAAKLLASLGSR